jgi:hypothetical protein
MRKKEKNVFVALRHGDQIIGRFFARWAIVFYGQFFEKFRSSPIHWASAVKVVH